MKKVISLVLLKGREFAHTVLHRKTVLKTRGKRIKRAFRINPQRQIGDKRRDLK